MTAVFIVIHNAIYICCTILHQTFTLELHWCSIIRETRKRTATHQYHSFFSTIYLIYLSLRNIVREEKSTVT